MRLFFLVVFVAALFCTNENPTGHEAEKRNHYLGVYDSVSIDEENGRIHFIRSFELHGSSEWPEGTRYLYDCRIDTSSSGNMIVYSNCGVYWTE